MALENLKETRKESITVGFLVESNRERLKLTLVNGDVGFDREIRDKNIHRPGLALAGYVELFTFNRVQVFGNTEIRYLQHLNMAERIKAFENICKFALPLIILTNDNKVDQELVDIATEQGISILMSPLATTKLVYFISDFLDDHFSPQTVVHGAMLDVYGIGVLLVGRSGIGKSEIALDLIERGHRLVADDVVMLTQKGEGILMASGTDVVKHFMEIRGLGLLDIRAVFGVRSIRFQKRVEVVVELEDWQRDEEYTRTGLDSLNITLLGVEIPHIKLPIFPGKNVTVIVEVIALDYLLRHYGYDAAREFAKRLDVAIAEKTKGRRAINYFEHDFE
ncbi:MAG: HPr(Ser) kinase/phosphatase [bacterium]